MFKTLNKPFTVVPRYGASHLRSEFRIQPSKCSSPDHMGEIHAGPNMFTQLGRCGCHMELTGIEPVTSAVRLQRSPS